MGLGFASTRLGILRIAAATVALGVSGMIASCAHSMTTQVPDGQVSTVAGSPAENARSSLPFVTEHAHRWNSRNAGTAYEPCTALASAEIIKLGIEPSSVHDAAGTDGQTLRGCAWRYMRTSKKEWGWSVSQFVANSPSLAADKQRYSLADDIWLQDAVLDGRTVGIHRTATLSDCDTYVQSGAAGVHTLVMYIGPTPPPPSEICDRAIAFTRATISKMPL